MDVCPKCGRKLKITDLKPECPGCGVNLLYYKIEERLEVDAINAELEHAKTQKRIDRAKASMIGSALTIVRIVLLAVSVGMLFLPLATLHTVGPYFDNTLTINAIEIYNKISALDFDGLFTMLSSPILGKSMIFFSVTVVAIALAAVCALLGLVMSFLSCSPHGFSRNLTLSILGMASTVVSIVFYNLFISEISAALPDIISGSVGIGAYLTIAGFALVLGINIAIKVKGVSVKYKQNYIDSVPYEDFIANFGNKKYDLDSLEKVRDDIAKHKTEYLKNA